MNIDEMQAGPELDGLIHEKVMSKTGPAEPYSTDIAAAWKVVEELRSSFTVQVFVFNRAAGFPPTVYECQLWVSGEPEGAMIGKADTMPLAVCRAALKVAGE